MKDILEYKDSYYRLTPNRFSHISSEIPYSAREEDENGVVCQTGAFINTSDAPISINYDMSKFVFHGGEYEVYTQSNTWQNENQGGWQTLITSRRGA